MESKYYYSASVGNFLFADHWAGNLPGDAVPVTDKDYEQFREGIAKGKILDHTNKGKPKLVDPTPVEGQELQDMLARRAAAYRIESDPLYMEWQFDQTDTKKEQWRASVEAIKARYPLP